MKAISHFILIFTVGMAIGYFIDKDKTISSIDIVESAHIKKPVESSVAVESALQIQGDLETEVKALQARIAFLEAQLLETQQTDDSASDNIVQNDRHEEKLSVENLLKAGVTEMMAQDIVDRMSQHEFQLLELHDRARREGYLNTSRYAKERRELMTTSPSLKAAIGDDTYDRYLYITGQNNRVVVTSVMSDSPADQLGVQADDII
ncbi:MAG: hypothetical protein OEY61_05825, partial [Gammaproteobacteria bacterium]|nr:hypothetical protein [Gammaproteobacteria bacterium]